MGEGRPNPGGGRGGGGICCILIGIGSVGGGGIEPDVILQ